MSDKLSNFDIQRVLASAGHYKAAIDGDLGPLSLEAAEVVLRGRHKDWTQRRRFIAAVQTILNSEGHEAGSVDGFDGYNTQMAYAAWTRANQGLAPDNWRDDQYELEEGEPLPVVFNDWGKQRQVERRFGKAGGPQCTAGKVVIPWRCFLAWNKASVVRTVSCHEDTAQSVERIFNRVASHYSPTKIKELGLDLFGGCYNYRKMRGGSSLSIHAYGCAWDFDPERNQLKWGRDRARLAKPDAEQWFKFWEEEGWTSLGRALNYDWMHTQAPGL